MAEWLECWTCNQDDLSSSPTLTAIWICFTENLSFKSSATLVNSQLVHPRPVGALNPVMVNLYVDLIIYSMALKSPDGELSLEIVNIPQELKHTVYQNPETKQWGEHSSIPP